MSSKHTTHTEDHLNEGEPQTAETATETLSVEELQKQLEESLLKRDQHWDRILRMQADLENAQRRTERDVANAHKYALEKFVNELLPVIDSLEACLSITNPAAEDAIAHAVLEGVRLTLKTFYAAIEKFGVKQVDPLSQPFNPDTQQAISMQPADNVPPGTVVSVLQKGYLLNDRLVRPALVVVSQAAE
ncbi:MAG TPA: nucleotide exchange factor GrpE [Gammaproteobacteria bacterium]|nr:nucleotide exchange factor GrpE [Gammaproteobacteria bacterium]